MTQRDDDLDFDDDRPRSRRRASRDVLNLGEPDDAGSRRGSAARRADHPRDLDEDRDRYGRGNDRDRSNRRGESDDDREPDRRRERSNDDRRRDPPRDRDARRRDDDDRDERAPSRPSKGDEEVKTTPPKQDGKGDESKGEDKDGDKAAGNEKAGQEERKGRRPVVIAIAAVVALLVVAGCIYYYLANRDKVDTDDANTDGRAVAIAPRVSGQVVSLDVTDNQFVHKGDPLIHIDPRQYIFSRDQSRGMVQAVGAQVANQKLGIEIAKKNFPASLLSAQGNLNSAKANLLLQESNYNRQKGLPKQATTQQDVDSATSGFQQAQAQVQEAEARVTQAEPVKQNIGQTETQADQLTAQQQQAQAQLDQAELNIEWTVVRAPQDGWVTQRNVETGNYVTAGTQIMSLVPPDIWVTANFKETQLDGMRPGQRVKISVDAHPDLDLEGHVDSIQRGSGSKFSAFPAQNATGNFVKIVQRVPVKIVIDSGLKPDEPLPLGISVTPTVYLK